MKKAAKLIGIIAGVIIVIVIIAALASPPTSVSPANSAEQLDTLVSNDMILQDVYDLMSSDLQNKATRFPALSIEEISEGNWHFIPKDNAEPGDTDAPYFVLGIPPEQYTDEFFMLFFYNNQLFDKAWFDYDGGWNIIDKLWTAQEK